MKKLLFLILVLTYTSCNQNKIKPNPSEIRIISLSPHITEIIYKLGMESDLVAVTDFCKYPPQAKKKESIGGLLNPNIEKIISLNPTHLFGVPAHNKLNQEISKFGFKILMLPNETLQDIQNTITIISDTLNISNKGIELNDSISKKFSNMTVKKKPVRIMLVIGREKGSVKNITVAGPETYISEISAKCGAKNIFNDLTNRYSTINIEEIIKRNPEIIVEINPEAPGGVDREKQGKEWQILQQVDAVKNQQIFTIGGNYALIPGPRVVKLAEDFKSVFNLLP